MSLVAIPFPREALLCLDGRDEDDGIVLPREERLEVSTCCIGRGEGQDRIFTCLSQPWTGGIHGGIGPSGVTGNWPESAVAGEPSPPPSEGL